MSRASEASRVDLAELSTFVAVADRRSFARAAEQLGLSRSTVSSRIRHLETRLGTELLSRSSHAVELTDAGARMYEHASRALQELAQAQVVVAGLSVEPIGLLRVRAPAAVASAVLMPIVARFAQRYPEVDVSLRVGGADAVAPEDEVDVALQPGGDAPAGWTARLLARYDWRLYASRQYLEDRGTPQVPRELDAHRVVVFSDEFLKARFSHQRTRAWQDAAPRRFVSVDDVQASCAAILAGAGVGLLPGYLAHAAVEAGQLVPVLGQWRPVHSPAGTLYALYRRSRLPAPKVSAFVDLLAQALGAPRRR
jgi:DNA-binding transcriptional LysR family regulator